MIERQNEVVTKTKDGKMTAQDVADWIATLPRKYRQAEFCAVFGGLPVSLKRVVALESKDGTLIAVAANGMGSHLPFDDSLKWEHVLD